MSFGGRLDYEVNSLGQPVGLPVVAWEACPRPARRSWGGRFCRVEPLDVDLHGPDLYRANSVDEVDACGLICHRVPLFLMSSTLGG